MSNYDFMMTTTYNEIKNQIIQLWMDYDKDGVMHTATLNGNLNVGMFSPDELWNNGTN